MDRRLELLYVPTRAFSQGAALAAPFSHLQEFGECGISNSQQQQEHQQKLAAATTRALQRRQRCNASVLLRGKIPTAWPQKLRQGSMLDQQPEARRRQVTLCSQKSKRHCHRKKKRTANGGGSGALCTHAPISTVLGSSKKCLWGSGACTMGGCAGRACSPKRISMSSIPFGVSAGADNKTLPLP